MDDAELSSRRQNLEDELRRVQETVVTLDTHITELKQKFGWQLPQSPHSHDAHLQLWRSMSGRPPVAEAVREVAHTRARGRKPRTTRPRSRPTEPPHTSTPFKRPRVLSSKDKRLEAIWTQCASILSTLKKHRYAWPFMQPVDAEALNIPDYYEVISQPMDLSTISQRLEHDPRRGRQRQYSSPLEFRDDIRQVWTNCRTYNKPGQDVRVMGDTLSEVWEKKWSHAEIESKWNQEHGSQDEAGVW